MEWLHVPVAVNSPDESPVDWTSLALSWWSQRLQPIQNTPTREEPSHPQAWSLLLELPRELRDEIIALVLVPPLMFHPVPANTPRAEMRDIWLKTGSDGQNVLYPTTNTPAIIHAMPLLLTSRQIRDETLAAMHRLSDLFAMNVDIHDSSEGKLYRIQPTWMCVPYLGRRMGHVHAKVCIRSAPQRGWMSAFVHKTDGVYSPIMLRCLFDILERLVRVGPVHADESLSGLTGHRKSQFDRGISLRKLTIDIVTPATLPKKCAFLPEECNPLDPEDNSQYLFRVWTGVRYAATPKYAAALLEHNICTVLKEKGHFGELLYHRLNALELRVDGEHVRLWEMAKELDSLQPPSPEKWAKFDDWKRETIKIRAGMGLQSTASPRSFPPADSPRPV